MEGGARAVDEFSGLVEELTAAFGGGGVDPWPDERFEHFALRVFRWQFGSNPVYRRFAQARGATPDTVGRWQDVPPVPATAFKHLPLISGDPARVERVFRTSGTTQAGQGGEHHVPSLALYRASLLPAFRAHLLPDGASLPFLSLIPSPDRQPHSSLSTMVAVAMDALGAEGSGWFAEEDGRLDADGLARALSDAERSGRPVLLAGTAFAFVHWLDDAPARGAGAARHRLPPGSRLFETGGFKGRSRAVPRAELYGALGARLGMAPEWMINEYGMTELLSQYYEPGLGVPVEADSLEGALAARRLAPPPWLRFRVLDPVTLAPVPDGERGLLCHHDLANVGSASVVLTEDVGVRRSDGLELLGRTPGAEPRGCSVAMDELLSAANAG